MRHIKLISIILILMILCETFPAFADATIALMDINPERLDFIRRACERIAADGKYPAKIVATLDRREALEGADGVVEIGYGIREEHQGRGYATEAVEAAVLWALRDPRVSAVEAEAEESNLASIRVLEKCGFVPNGTLGEEGPRYTLKI